MRVYTIVSASLLLVIAIIGLAFHDLFSVPTHILIVNLLLGLWGMWEIFKPKK